MAEASLIFNEEGLTEGTPLYNLYHRLYGGMRSANMVDAPDFSDNPPLTSDGEIDIDTIDVKMAEYSTILMKNSAYMMANSIVSSIGSGGGTGGEGGTGNYISRSGDSMEGMFGAQYGLQAGYGGYTFLETTKGADDENIVIISSKLLVDGDVNVSGKIDIGNEGIFMSDAHVLYFDDNKLNLSSGYIQLNGEVGIDGSLNIGDITINESGLFFGDTEFYHGGNSNKSDVDWSMRNGHVYGKLIVDGETNLNDNLTALNGFRIGANNNALFYSDKNANNEPFIQLATDLSLSSGYGIKFDGKYIIKSRSGTTNVVSFSAPGMTMNLGDSDGETQTAKIALQTGIFNYNSDYQIVSQYGDGNFPNSLSAGCGNSGPTVLRTYYASGNDCGIVFQKRVRFFNSTGPYLSSTDIDTLNFNAPYVHVLNDIQYTDNIGSSISYKQTNSLFKDLSKPWSSSLNFDTESEFFVFNKPIESTSFSIISDRYKTRLIENALLFGDGVFLEGIVGGMLHSGDAYFTGNLGSERFASGFAGYGWGIHKDKTYGSIVATFDEIVARKKFRAYELEVQKSTVTNGSLWVSDSCSGDVVEEIL